MATMTSSERRSRPWYNDPITIRQRAAIDLIRQMLGISFVGQNKGQASAFIGEHYDRAKEIRAIRDRNQAVGNLNNRDVAELILEEAGPWEN